MAHLHFSNIALHLRLKLPTSALRSEVAANPEIVGQTLADAVIAFERKHRLGYYPALDFYRSQTDFDAELLNAIDGIAWIACQMAHKEVVRSLRGAFSRVSIDSIQSAVHLLPPVRPNQLNAAFKLAQHFTPDSVKLVVNVSVLQRHAGQEGLTGYTRKMAWKWLTEKFERVEVLHAELISSKE